MEHKFLLKWFAISIISILSINTTKAQKPNILWIITDDQRADAMACFNRATTGKSESALGYVESPNIDAFANDGVLFTNAYCNSPGCAPSRASMHYGVYPHHSGVYGFEYHHDAPEFVKKAIPQVMKQQGYNTARFGKLGIRVSHRTEAQKKGKTDYYNFEIDKKDLLAAGLTDFYPHTIHQKKPWKRLGKKDEWYYPDGKVVSYWADRADGNIPQEDKNKEIEHDKAQHVIRSYVTHVSILGGESTQPGPKTMDGRITEAFQEYLEHPNSKYKALDGRMADGPKTKQPQFINLGYHFPHTPVLPPKSFRDRFNKKKYKIPAFSMDEVDAYPPQLKKWFKKMQTDKMSDKDKRQFISDYYAFCAFGDSLMGASIRSFKEYCKKNQQEYLIVITCGDHGWHLGEQGTSTKFANFDKSNHSSVLVASSDKNKFPPKKVISDYVEFVDFAPTFFSAVGLDMETKQFEHLDGYDLAKVVNKKKKPRAYVIGEQNHVYGPRAFIRCKDFAFSMRVREWNSKPKSANILKDIKWAMTTTPEKAEMTLFDLRIDPDEHRNIADSEEYKALAEWFRKKLGNIVLGDGRVECDWSKLSNWKRSKFAAGADDKQLDIPSKLIPKVQ